MTNPDARWVLLLKSAALIGITAAAVSLGISLRAAPLFTAPYFWQNQADDAARVTALAWIAAVSICAVLAVIVPGAVKPHSPGLPPFAWWLARKLAPLGPLGILPVLFDWELWQRHDLTFLILVQLNALALGSAVGAFASAEPVLQKLPWLKPATGRLRARLRSIVRVPHPAQVWLLLAIAASLGYVAWFSYHTTVWHLAVRSGYDLAIEDNILYNLLHGGPFFKAAPTLGPTGSHFGRHATLIAYLFLPFYAMNPSAETILIIQSALMGVAGIPLFLFARRHLGGATALLVSIAYLFHPALQQSNLFEAHYVKFGLPFLWALLWLLDSRRHRLALLAALLTLLVREDVASWVVIVGLWSIYFGRSLRVGLLLATVGMVYVITIKLVIMPLFSQGGDDLVFMYRGLLPEGKHSFAWVLVTVITNPAFTLESLLEKQKLVYLLQILVPLGLLPLRHRVGWFALIPGAIFCLLATRYPALTDIHFQYSPHFLVFLLPALVIAMAEGENGAKQTAPLRRDRNCAILFAALLPCSYQYGAVLQPNTSRGGPIPYLFGWDDGGRQRRTSLDELLEHLPETAKVAGSAFTVPQISARPNGYSLALGIYDAEWFIAPMVVQEYTQTELPRTREALQSGEWGVVAISGPFFLARRGHPANLNAEILSTLRAQSAAGARPIGRYGDR